MILALLISMAVVSIVGSVITWRTVHYQYTVVEYLNNLTLVAKALDRKED